VVGTAHPWDVIELPETNERFVRALDRRGTLASLPSWTGEGDGA
jgi:hypothetical protein